MSRQLEFFAKPKQKRHWRAHVADIGFSDAPIAQYRCARCGWESDYLTDDGDPECKKFVARAWRGIPCPHCNASKSA